MTEEVVAVLELAFVDVEAPAAAWLPPWAMITPAAPRSGTSSSAVTECDLFLMLITAFSWSRRMPQTAAASLPLHDGGTAREAPIERSTLRSSSGNTLYFVASNSNRRCSSASLSGCSRRQVVRLSPVGAGVVQLPDIVLDRSGAALRLTHGVPCRVTAIQPW